VSGARAAYDRLFGSYSLMTPLARQSLANFVRYSVVPR
jgi:hypothetical protein